MDTARTATTGGRQQQRRDQAARRLRATQQLRRLRWPLAVAVGGVTVILGFLGHRVVTPDGDAGLWLYQTLQLFALEGGAVEDAPWTLAVARLLAPAVAGYAIWQALSAVFSQQVTNLRARRLGDHVIVCGLGDKGQLLTRSLLAAGYRVVGIDVRADVDAAGVLRDDGVLLVSGDARDAAILRRAGVDRARYLVAVCTDDATNAEIAGQLRTVQRGLTEDPLTAYVHVISPELTQLLRASVAGDDNVRLEFFDIYESGARALLGQFPPFDIAPGDADPPHLLLVGFGDLARNALRMAALRAALATDAAPRPVVSVVAADAETLVTRFVAQSAPVARDFRIRPHTVGTSGAPLVADLQAALGDAPRVTAAYICLNNDADSLTTALRVSQVLARSSAPIVVALWESAGLAGLVAGTTAPGIQALSPFPVLQRTCTADLVLGGLHEALARAFHREYLARSGESADPAAVEWDELAPALQESNRRAADSIRNALATVGCRVVPLTDGDNHTVLRPADVEVLARIEHERWRAERTRQGWTLGDRDVERRRSPLLVSWDELPEDAKDHNRRWAQSLPEHLHANGLQITRVQ